MIGTNIISGLFALSLLGMASAAPKPQIAPHDAKRNCPTIATQTLPKTGGKINSKARSLSYVIRYLATKFVPSPFPRTDESHFIFGNIDHNANNDKLLRTD
jgi:hypothetical protein